MRLYDLTATFSEDLPIYGNDPRVVITEYYSMARGQSCNVSRLDFGCHTGTHADTPKHFIDDGDTCDTVSLTHFLGMAKVFDLRGTLDGRQRIEPADLEPLDIGEGDIVLFNTGNSPLMRDSAFHTDYTSLSPEAAAFLVEKRIKTIGIDYLSVEGHGSKEHGTHLSLLGNGICILEGLVFDNDPLGFVPQGTYLLSALPLKIKNGNGSPVRAVLADARELRLVIFDMDGLILDTETISVAGWEQAGREKGFTISQALSDRLFGCNLPTCKQRMEEHFGSGFDFEAAYAVRTAYVMEYTKKHGVPVKPGVTALLDLLDKRGIEKCVATSTDYKRAVELLTTVGLEKRFDRIIGGDSFENGKPNPEIFLTAARECQTPPMHALVLEDSAVGVEAAYAAGMRVIVVPDLSKPDKRTLGQVIAICKDLNEAAAVIKHI